MQVKSLLIKAPLTALRRMIHVYFQDQGKTLVTLYMMAKISLSLSPSHSPSLCNSDKTIRIWRPSPLQDN